MSDTGRKGVGEQISEGITPDSQKSTLDKASESVTDAGDKVAASVQPGDSKSTTQKLSDEVGGSTSSTEGKPILEQAQEMAGQAYNVVSQAALDLKDAVTDAVSGEKK